MSFLYKKRFQKPGEKGKILSKHRKIRRGLKGKNDPDILITYKAGNLSLHA